MRSALFFTMPKCAAAAAALAVLLLGTADKATAGTNDSALIQGAKLCTAYLPRHEREYGIPVHLLAAIASTESGRYNKEIGLSLPWPWTINVEGKGYFFDTKEQAIAAVRELQKRGFQSIDVGCMQVNLHHHPNAFASLDQAFDPAYNIAYAARFLKQNFNEEGSWRKATGDYHSRTPIFGEQYSRLVFGSWSRIINKIAEAHTGKLALKGEAPQTAPISLPEEVASNGTRHAPRHSYHPFRLHSISVYNESTREKGVLVIRPSHNAASTASVREDMANDQFVTYPQKSQQRSSHRQAETDLQAARVVKASTATEKGQFSPDPHIVHTDAEAAKTGPNNSLFVFDN
ncbi:MAG TPA: lytic transglycosylase domain-containing protein [Rickettsiales bacterium]|nr:lytic transglycosylase domain-containing protein [Rickettsiales bacterium]